MEKSIEYLRADLAESPTIQGRYADQTTDTERILAEVLAGVVGVEQVSVDSHFFEDLGANSLVMAQFCARVRKRPGLPSVSMKDIYQHPTIRSLTTALTDTAPTTVERILAEVLAGVVGVERVSVDSHFFEDLGANSLVMAQFCARVRKRPDLPSVSMKDVYQHPTIRSLTTALTDTAPTSVERIFAEVLAGVVGVERVSVDSHFFEDLGANSLVMAQFCARVRKRPDLPSVSMKDVYRHPTIRSLATALADTTPTSVESPVPASTEVTTQTSTLQYVLCGTLQFLIFLGYSSLVGFILDWAYNWISASSGLIDIYLRSVLIGGAIFVSLCTFPIVAKWILIGRWKAGEFPVWGLTYLRFWIVKALIHINPMFFFIGTPLYVLYLRALGARIGKGVTILSHSVPVCTDLLTIGAGTVIRKDSFFLCYRAHAGRIQTGPVTLGRDVYIGEKTVLDINTSMGDGAQLGHTSALQSGEAVPDGQRWHGSPAQRTQLDYLRVAPANCGTLRRVSYGLSSLLVAFFVFIPLAIGGFYMLLSLVPALAILLGPDSEITSPVLYIDALVLSLLLFLGFCIVGLLVVFTVPRLLNLVIKPDKVYPLYGFHYLIHLVIARMTNIKFFNWLFGDSSYIVHYLCCLGLDLSLVEQTGANFGSELQLETPYLSSVGGGTIVCDGLSIINADFSSTSFCVSRVSIGSHNFLGNNLAFPSGARTGDNCLLATKTMIPLDGKVREGVGLLGSPSFEIPRSVERDSRFDHLRTGDELRRRLAAKNRYNIRTMGLFLFIRWLHVFALTLLGLLAIDNFGMLGPIAFTASLVLSLVFSAGYFVLIERALMGFRVLRPQFRSIYDPYYWWHERLWKVPDHYLDVFNGTPFKNVIWRLLGVRLGSKVFDDGSYLTERTLTIIGNNCTLNAATKIQCHSLEDGTFKSDYTTLGAGCTLGVGAFVHYGVTMGDGAVLAADSFLMKGEEIPPHARWGGNPARALAGSQAARLTEPVPAQLVVHHEPSQGREGQRDHLDEGAHLAGQNKSGVQVCRGSNNHCGATPVSGEEHRGKVEDFLGRSNFGATYLVRDQHTRDVSNSLFVLKEVVEANKQERHRLVSAGKLLRRLHHPGLPRVRQVLNDDKNNRVYMLMDYIAGQDLETLRHQQTEEHFSWTEVMHIMAPIIAAVTYLHQQQPPIIHDDIKPANIIMSREESEVVLVDFSIIKANDPGSTTVANRYCYRAPEQSHGSIDVRTDIYALGATFYTLVTGKLPPDARSRVTQVGNEAMDPLEPVNSVVPAIPMHMGKAIERAMSLDAEQRFSSVEQFWEVLWLVLAEQPAPVFDKPSVPQGSPAVPTSELGQAVGQTIEKPVPELLLAGSEPESIEEQVDHGIEKPSMAPVVDSVEEQEDQDTEKPSIASTERRETRWE